MSPEPEGGVQEYELFIDGEFRESQGDNRIDVGFPYNGNVWASVPDGTAEDIDDAVQVARGAFEREFDGYRLTRSGIRNNQGGPTLDFRDTVALIADRLDHNMANLTVGEGWLLSLSVCSVVSVGRALHGCCIGVSVDCERMATR